MKHALRYTSLISFLTIFIISTSRAQVADTTMSAIYSMSIEELMNTKVTIATKSEQSISKTPSVVSVITAQDIKAMGFKEIQELLQIIPGIEFTQTRTGAKSGGVRGVSDTRIGGRALILLDGTQYNDVMYGSALYFGAEFNLDDIDRVEVIRGPGSALYGRNAFSMVINIITKKATHNNQVEAEASTGSYRTYDANLSYGIKKENSNAFISMKYYSTDGTDSKFDNGMGGLSTWDLKHKNYYLNTNFQFKNFQFYGSFIQREDGVSSGIFLTDGNTIFKIGTYNLLYSNNLSPVINVRFKLFGQNENRVQNVEQFKPNTTAIYPLYGVPVKLLAPEGIYAQPIYDEYLYGGELEFNWDLIENNNLLFGVQMDVHGANNASVRANYDLMTNFPLTYKEDSVVKYYTKYNMPLYKPGWITDNGHEYKNAAFYFQDIYHLKENLGFTVGGRFDMDSETGFIFNPRLGIVWEPLKYTYCKLLYGKAYRTPTTSEQYKIVGFDRGNKNLKYEEIHTTELVLGSKIKNLHFQLSGYFNKLKNLILQQYVNDTSKVISYFNNGQNTSYGFEFEGQYFISKTIYSFINYSYVHSEDTKDVFGQKVISPQAGIANHLFNFGFNISFYKYFNYNLHLSYQGPISKFENTNPSATNKYISQDKVGNFVLTNSSFRIVNLVKGLEFSLYGYNLLNTKYYFQDDINAHQPLQPGRNFLIKAIYTF